MTLLERDGLLAQLDARWSQAREGPGQLVFIEGEAGIGKTTVLRAFATTVRADNPVYWGACEAMATPRPLGALDDIALDSGGKLAIAHDGSGEQHRLFVAFVELLAERPALPALDAEKIRFGGEVRADYLLSNRPGVDHRVQQLAFVCLHKRIAQHPVKLLPPTRFLLLLPVPLPA